MKIIITKIASFSLAFLVLFSTFSFSVDSHYCGNTLIDISYVSDAKVCKSEMKDNFSIKMKDCCSIEIQKVEGQDELQIHYSKELETTKQQLKLTQLISYGFIFIEESSKHIFYKDFSSIGIPINYQVLYQSFLI